MRISDWSSDVCSSDLPEEFGRIGAQAAKQAILQKIRDAERAQVLNDFLERGENIVSGTVKRMDKGDAIIETGKIEARLPRPEMITQDNIRLADPISSEARRVGKECARTVKSLCAPAN